MEYKGLFQATLQWQVAFQKENWIIYLQVQSILSYCFVKYHIVRYIHYILVGLCIGIF